MLGQSLTLTVTLALALTLTVTLALALAPSPHSDPSTCTEQPSARPIPAAHSFSSSACESDARSSATLG